MNHSPGLRIGTDHVAYHISPQQPAISSCMHLRRLFEAMEARDPELVAHGRRTADYAWALGQAVGLASAELHHVHYAAILHDVGKLTLPDEIWRKDGPLNDREYAALQCHPREGARLLQSIPGLRQSSILIAHHHEHWDGSGYPYGLRGTLIPLGSRVLAIADRFDSLCSAKDGLAEGEKGAMKFLKMLGGSQLDPMLVEVFRSCVQNDPGMQAESVG